jgi:hypothetical protein
MKPLPAALVCRGIGRLLCRVRPRRDSSSAAKLYSRGTRREGLRRTSQSCQILLLGEEEQTPRLPELLEHRAKKRRPPKRPPHYVNIRSRSAAPHRCPTDHTDRAYRYRPAPSNPVGSRSLRHRHSNCNRRDGGDRNTNPQLLEPRCLLRLRQ